MPPILITGAAGFIGFHVAQHLLKNGYSVVGIDNLNDYYDVQLKQDRLAELTKFDKFQFFKIDITDRAALETLWREAGPFKQVIHLAAQAGVRYSLIDPYAYINSNCMGHLTMLEMCRHTDGFSHFIYASSSSVYGSNTKLPYSLEDRVDTPVSLYAATKRAGELISQSYSHLYKIPQTGLRFFTVYGPWGRPDMSPILFTKAILDGSQLRVFNHGNMRRDFTYVQDVVDNLVSLLDKPPGQDETFSRILNIGNTKSERLMDFIEVIEANLNKKANLSFEEHQAGDVIETYADIKETVAITGITPSTTIHEGIPRFLDWYKAYYKA